MVRFVHFQASSHSSCLRRHPLAAQVENAVDIEHNEQLAFEPVNAVGQGGELAAEIDRTGLALDIRQLEHFANRIDQEAERLPRASMPIAMTGAPSSRRFASSRRRMSIAVTMRPRKFNTPAISAPASGTRVIRDGLNTSCTREIGKPNICPATVKVTNSVKSVSSCIDVSPPARSRRLMQVFSLFLDRRDQPGPIELGDKIVEADSASALDRVGRDHGG